MVLVLLAAGAGGPSLAAVDAVDDAQLLLFTDQSLLARIDPQLELRNHQPAKGPLVITPTEPWEGKVFAYNHVVHVGPGENRMYYDCIENPSIRRICLATSVDGVTWTKPNLGVFSRNGSTANNIVLLDSGNSVFLDKNPAVPASQKWKMTCSAAAYSSPDGIRWARMNSTGGAVVHGDDSKPTGNWDPRLKKYVIYDRTRVQVRGQVTRSIGRCVTDDFTHWEKETPGGKGPCPTVFSVDLHDPSSLDVYTNAWTPYPSIESPAVHLFFPSMYHHFGADAPWGFGNDGLLDIRMVASRDGIRLNYTTARNGRAPFVPLGINDCGESSTTPSVEGGWCSPFSGVEARTSADTSAMYMASGYVASVDGHSLFFYSSAQPFTHGDRESNQTYGNNTGIRLNALRRDGFVSIDAPYTFGTSGSPLYDTLPDFLTTTVTVPSGCPAPIKKPLPVVKNQALTGCSYEAKCGNGDVCTGDYKNVSCATTADCHPLDKKETCQGHEISCKAGLCETGLPGGILCKRDTKVLPHFALTGGVQLTLNVETSVAGFVAVEVQTAGGTPVSGMELNASDVTKGSAVGAVASWGGGALASLSSLAGKDVQIRVAMTDASLYSIRLSCASP
jgi:hypothetical protein